MRYGLGRDDMVRQLDKSVDFSQRTAMVLLALFLVAVLAALAVTLYSVASSVGILAASVVSPIIGLTLLFLYFERRRRPWSFAGAAFLGMLGVTLRLIVNSQSQLEVGGGLPLWVTVTYVALGSLVVATSLWAILVLRRANRTGKSGPPSSTGRSPA
jgi:FtsH-binding integral membrane protein